MVEIISKGMKMEGCMNPMRDSYVRVSVEIIDDLGRDVETAWYDAVSLVQDIYGVTPTEDNTVGQIAQMYGADGSKRKLPVKGRVFSLGLNLYGMKVRKLHARILEKVKQYRLLASPMFNDTGNYSIES